MNYFHSTDRRGVRRGPAAMACWCLAALSGLLSHGGGALPAGALKEVNHAAAKGDLPDRAIGRLLFAPAGRRGFAGDSSVCAVAS